LKKIVTTKLTKLTKKTKKTRKKAEIGTTGKRSYGQLVAKFLRSFSLEASGKWRLGTHSAPAAPSTTLQILRMTSTASTKSKDYVSSWL